MRCHQLSEKLHCGTLTPTEALRAARAHEGSVLILDALDALRTSQGRGAIWDWLQTLRRETDWRVVMTVRTYEAEHSSHLRQMFSNHLVVNPLTDAEWNGALSQSPTLAAGVQQLSPRLLPDVLRNLFNLRLLAQLIHRLGTQAGERLRDVQSEVELYQVYWQEVVRDERGRGDSRADEREGCALKIAARVVENNEMRVSYDRVVGDVQGNVLSSLVKDGVLQKVDLSEGIRCIVAVLEIRRVGFHEMGWGEEVLKAFREWLSELPEDELAVAFAVLREHNRRAALWNVCLDLAASHPDRFAESIHFLLAEPIVWQYDDTRPLAYRAAEACWQYFTPHQRATVEIAVMQMNVDVDSFISTRTPTGRANSRDRILLTLAGDDNNGLVTPQAQAIANDARIRGVIASGPADSTVNVEVGYGELDDLDVFGRVSPAYRESPIYATTRAAIGPVATFVKTHYRQPPSLSDLETAVTDAQRLQAHLNQHRMAIKNAQLIGAVRQILAVTGIVVRTQEVSPSSPVFSWAREWLVADWHHPNSRTSLGVQSSNTVTPPTECRLEVAQWLPWLAHREGDVAPDVAELLWKLATDPDPSVRQEIALKLWFFTELDETFTWKLAELFVREERQAEVLFWFFNHSVQRWESWRPEQSDKLLEIVLKRLERGEIFSKRNGGHLQTVDGLQGEVGKILARVGLYHDYRPARERLNDCFQDLPQWKSLLISSVVDTLIWGEVRAFARTIFADHPDTLRDLPTAERLMRILETFAKAGWPNALDVLNELETVWR